VHHHPTEFRFEISRFCCSFYCCGNILSKNTQKQVSGSHVWERLSNQVDLQQRAAELETKKKELELEGCTFKPKTQVS
jgi:hypothetical protein